MEVEFGIEEYIGGKKEVIPCVLKQMYTDFIVEEILEDKRVLSIKVEKTEVVVVVTEPDTSIPVPEFLSAETIATLDQIGKKGEDGKIASKAFSIPTKELSKEQRTTLHGFIRARYRGQLNSETEGEAVDVTMNQTCTGGRKRKRWCPTLGNYLHFTLAKENKDTSYALGIVAKFLGVKPDLFRTCGIKDRRAVTAQRVSCYRVEKERLIALNPRLREIHLSDFEYKEDGLKMGGHWGNRFHIVLRNMPEDSVDTVMERAKSLSDSGFINYFGTQRFGSCTAGTAETGKLIIQRKWEEAVKHILFSGTHSKGTVPEAVACFKETGDAALAFRKLRGGQSYASIEGTIFRCLSRNGTWQQCMCDALPVNMRSLYVHAYQSLLWNKIASRRLRDFGMDIHADDVDAEGKCLEGKGTIYDVYIPLPGSDINLFPKYAQPWVTELLEADGLTTQSIRGLKDRFALGDCSRPLMVLPSDVKAEFIRYAEPRALLQNGLKVEELKEVGDKDDKSLPLLALKIEFSLPQGTYATVALREVTGYDMGKKNMMNFGKADDASEANNGSGDKADSADSEDEVDPA